MKSTNSLSVGDNIPNFNLKSIEGINFSISEIIGKNNLVLHFFKSIKDYSPCQSGSSFSNFASGLFLKNTKLVAISSKMSSPNEFLDETLVKLSRSFNLLNDEDDELRSFFGLCKSNEPTCNNMTFVVDRFGKIKAKMESNDSVSSLMDNTLEFVETMQ